MLLVFMLTKALLVPVYLWVRLVSTVPFETSVTQCGRLHGGRGKTGREAVLAVFEAETLTRYSPIAFSNTPLFFPPTLTMADPGENTNACVLIHQELP